MFCYAEYIESEMNSLFEKKCPLRLEKPLQRPEYAKRAPLFLAELNAIHPFRQGDGRSQLAYLPLLSTHVGHPLDQQAFNPKLFLVAMFSSFQGDLTLLEHCVMNGYDS